MLLKLMSASSKVYTRHRPFCPQKCPSLIKIKKLSKSIHVDHLYVLKFKVTWPLIQMKEISKSIHVDHLYNLRVQSDLADPAVNVGPGDVSNLSGHQTVNAIVYPHLFVSQQSISWILPIMVYRSVAGIQAVLCERPDKKQAVTNFLFDQHCS